MSAAHICNQIEELQQSLWGKIQETEWGGWRRIMLLQQRQLEEKTEVKPEARPTVSSSALTQDLENEPGKKQQWRMNAAERNVCKYSKMCVSQHATQALQWALLKSHAEYNGGDTIMLHVIYRFIHFLGSNLDELFYRFVKVTFAVNQWHLFKTDFLSPALFFICVLEFLQCGLDPGEKHNAVIKYRNMHSSVRTRTVTWAQFPVKLRPKYK